MDNVVNLDLFWKGVQDLLPNFSRIALIYKDVVTSSADAEKSNSLYKLVLNACRRSLSVISLQSLLFLYYNNKRLSGAADDENESALFDFDLY